MNLVTTCLVLDLILTKSSITYDQGINLQQTCKQLYEFWKLYSHIVCRRTERIYCKKIICKKYGFEFSDIHLFTNLKHLTFSTRDWNNTWMKKSCNSQIVFAKHGTFFLDKLLTCCVNINHAMFTGEDFAEVAINMMAMKKLYMLKFYDCSYCIKDDKHWDWKKIHVEIQYGILSTSVITLILKQNVPSHLRTQLAIDN